MLHTILEQSRDNNVKQSGFAPVKRLRTLVLAAIMIVCLTTTAFAAAYIGLDEAFLKFLKPVDGEQAQYLSNGAYAVDETVTNKNGSLTIKQVIGDSNLTYILMDFTAPEGFVLNAKRYRFLNPNINAGSGSFGTDFHMLEDGNSNDNKISLVMSIMTKSSIVGKTVHFTFDELQAADPFPGIFETVISGDWQATVKFDFKEYSNLYEINQNIDMFGYEAILKSIVVSPISISLKIESEYIKEISDANKGSLKEVGENESLDDYPITINYRDGTSETTSIFRGLHLGDLLVGEIFTIKTFENVINDKEITSIVFFDREFSINN